MARSDSSYRPDKARSNWLLGGLLVCLGLVFLRLCDLQLLRHDYYTNDLGPRIAAGRPEGQIPTPGRLLSSGGEPLAESILRYHLVADPARMEENGEHFSAVAEQVAPLLHRPATELLAELQKNRGRGHVVLKRWVKEDLIKQVEAFKIEGLSGEQVWQRQYPLGKLAGHILGGRNQFHQAVEGLEYQYRLLLDGQPGAAGAAAQPAGLEGVTNNVNAAPPIPGKDIVLTLDVDIQRQVEAELDRMWAVERPKWASCIVLDPQTGAILALSSRPNYDPNDYVAGKPLPGYRWSPVRTEATINWPVTQAIEQGSTFKILLAAAALQSGKVSPGRTHYCGGHLKLGGAPISCWGKYAAKGHGVLDMAGMLAQSCNVCAGQTAGEVGKTYYRDFLVRCGIGSEPQSGLPGETPGLLAKLKNIRPRDLASMGFGQAVNCSALQLTSIVGGLVNDGVLVPPHILAAVRDADDRPFWEYTVPEGTRLCSSDVSTQLRDMLEGVVVRGTGKPAAIPGVRVGGKTGTAQQVDPKTGKHLPNRFIVSFISVLPIDKPRYIIHVECAEPKHGLHGSDVAAPVCQRLGKFIMERVASLPAVAPSKPATPPAGKVKKP